MLAKVKNASGRIGIFIYDDDDIILKTPWIDHRISDHDTVIADLRTGKPVPVRKTISYRKVKDIDVDSFDLDIRKSGLLVSDDLSADECVHQYNTVLSDILDKHAPICTCTVAQRAQKPWITNEFLESKRIRRQLERQWRRDKSDENRDLFTKQKNLSRSLLYREMTVHYRKTISDKKGDPKSLFKIVNSLLGKEKDNPFPPHDSVQELVRDFNDFFIAKNFRSICQVTSLLIRSSVNSVKSRWINCLSPCLSRAVT